MYRPSYHRAAHDRGFTLIEILITLGVITMIMALGYSTVRSIRKSSLREDTTEMIAVLRGAHVMATTSGVHHRVVFDLDEHAYRIEACQGDLALRRSEREEVPETDEDTESDLAAQAGAAADLAGLGGGGASSLLPALQKAAPGFGGTLSELASRLPGGQLPGQALESGVPAELLNAASPEAAAQLAEALAGTRIGTARCGPPELPTGDSDGRGSQRAIRRDEGLAIRRISVQHLEDEQREGIVHLNFFPLGYAEKAVIEIADEDDNAFTILVHRLTGRVELRTGTVDADEHMRRRADGEEEDER